MHVSTASSSVRQHSTAAEACWQWQRLCILLSGIVVGTKTSKEDTVCLWLPWTVLYSVLLHAVFTATDLQSTDKVTDLLQ